MHGRRGILLLYFAHVAWFAAALGIVVHALFYTHAHNIYLIYAPAIRRWWIGADIYVLQADYFRYSPLFAVSLSPLVFLPDSLASALWKLINIGIYWAGLRFAWRELTPYRGKPFYEGVFLLTVLAGSLQSVSNGQANCAMIGVLLGSLALAARERWHGSAALMALGVLIKSYALALGLLLAAWQPRRFLPRLVLWLGVGLALPFLTQTPTYVAAEYVSWAHHLRDSSDINRDRQRAVDNLFSLAGHPLQSATFSILGIAAGIGVLAWTRHLQRGGADRPMLLVRTYQGYALWTALFGPATEACAYAIVAPAIAWSCVEAYDQSAPRWRLGLLWLSMFLMGPAVTDMVGPLRPWTDTHGCQPLGALLFAMLLLSQTIRVPARIEAPMVAVR